MLDSPYCSHCSGRTACRVTRTELSLFGKISMGQDCPCCKHPYGVHPGKNSTNQEGDDN